jgi:hypothetical protein
VTSLNQSEMKPMTSLGIMLTSRAAFIQLSILQPPEHTLLVLIPGLLLIPCALIPTEGCLVFKILHYHHWNHRMLKTFINSYARQEGGKNEC